MRGEILSISTCVGTPCAKIVHQAELKLGAKHALRWVNIKGLSSFANPNSDSFLPDVFLVCKKNANSSARKSPTGAAGALSSVEILTSNN